ncbi:MAG: RNA polymerase factor sigma-54 [candidate division WOR-3 bacterium]
MRDKKIIPDKILRLELKQTPFLTLLLKIYHMSRLELSEFLKSEIENNLVLEEKFLKGKGEEEEREDFLLDEFIEGFKDEISYIEDYYEYDEPERVDLLPAPPPSLYERIQYQIESIFDKEIDKKIAYIILENLDENGYLSKDPQELAEIAGVGINKFEEVRVKFTRFDPVGIGAKDMMECIRIQLEEKGEEKQKIEKTIEYIKNIFKEGKSLEKTKEIEEILKHITFAPALKYLPENISYIYPDIKLLKREGKFIPIIEESNLPKVRLNRRYVEMLKSKEISKSEKEIIKKHFLRALDIFKAIVQRRENLRKISEFIIENNKDFLEGKVNKIFPITQVEAAEKMGIKTSTFHKLISKKYIDTPRGIFELKFFFPGGIKCKGGRISREEIKEIIKKLIENEDKNKPLSDKKIEELLIADGIKIKRRTVQKLREEMGIPNFKDRKVS